MCVVVHFVLFSCVCVCFLYVCLSVFVCMCILVCVLVCLCVEDNSCYVCVERIGDSQQM